MAKKTRRPNLSQETLERARREMSKASQVVETPASAAQPAAPGATKAAAKRTVPTTHEDLSVEYAYVITDLRNMRSAGFPSLLP